MSRKNDVFFCVGCCSTTPVWDNDFLVDAWQKKGYNFYKFECLCGETNIVKIKCEKKG